MTENNVAAQAGDEPMRQALQVCVKALEFRKERSANDEFALNLARIALAGSPCATADVERDKAVCDLVRLWDSESVSADDYNEEMCRIEAIIRVTTKPGA